ncbi:MAG: MlaD family protein [Betaproteobacteria bacterium]|nr:MlaD family protein [Betaproteobacteria bacterium]
MESRAHALLAGLFTLLLGAAAVFSLFWFSASNNRDFRELLVVSRQNISGLSPQARVSYRGIEVGRVLDIRLDPQDRRDILIHVQIDKNLPLGGDASARLSYQGITGVARIMLEDNEDSENLLPESISGQLPRIPLRAGLMNQLQDGLPELLGEAQSFMKQANALLNEENRRNLSFALARFESASARADQTLGSMQQMLSAENVRAMSEAMQKMPLLVEEARQMAQRVDSVAARLDSALGQGSDWNEGLVPQFSRMSRELTATSRQLDRVLKMLERSPQSLLLGAPPARPGPGEAGFTAPEEP